MSESDGILLVLLLLASMVMKRWQNQVGKLIESVANNFIHIFFSEVGEPERGSVAL